MEFRRWLFRSFPNMLFHYGPLSPSGFSNGPTAAELQGDWTTDFILHLRNEGFTRFEPDPAAECEWTEMVEQIGAMTLFPKARSWRSEEQPSGLQSPMRISYDVFCLKKKT